MAGAVLHPLSLNLKPLPDGIPRDYVVGVRLISRQPPFYFALLGVREIAVLHVFRRLCRLAHPLRLSDHLPLPGESQSRRSLLGAYPFCHVLPAIAFVPGSLVSRQPPFKLALLGVREIAVLPVFRHVRASPAFAANALGTPPNLGGIRPKRARFLVSRSSSSAASRPLLCSPQGAPAPRPPRRRRRLGAALGGRRSGAGGW